MSNSDNPGCLTMILDFFSLTPRPKIDYSLYSKRETILTKNELAFYEVLVEIINGKYLILPKIRLQDIFAVRGGSQYQSHFNRISSKHVDFLLCAPTTFQPIYGIELDDRSHRKPSTQTRDEFVINLFQSARLPLRRIPAKMKYTPEYVKAQVFPQATKESK